MTDQKQPLTGPEIVERFETAYLETIYPDRSDFVLSPQSSRHFLGFKAGVLAVLDAIRDRRSDGIVYGSTTQFEENWCNKIDALRREIAE